MTPRLLFLIFGLVILSSSCEKCKRCTYSYDVTTIEQGVNGEETVVTKKEGLILTGEDGGPFREECIKENKGESFTIEQWYQSKKDTTNLDNFDFSCVDF